MNGESNGERTSDERAANERMRELGRRSGEARRRKRERRDQELELDENGVPVDIERWSMQRLVKLGNSDSNIAGAVAAVKEARVRTYVDASTVSAIDARAELERRLDEIDARRRAYGEPCQACGGAGYIVNARRGPPRPRSGGRVHLRPVDLDERKVSAN